MIHDPNCPRRESGDERRAAIALAARDLIAERGLEGLRTRDIAQRVGINIATLHYHVPSKEALVSLVAASISDSFRAQYERRPRAGKNARELLRMEVEDVHETATEMPGLIVALAELTERGRRDPAIAAIIHPLRRFWHGQMVDILNRGIEDGSFRPDLDPQTGALILVGALSEYARMRDPDGSAHALLAELERAFARPTHSLKVQDNASNHATAD